VAVQNRAIWSSHYFRHDSVLTVRQNDLICPPQVIIARELSAAPIGGLGA
jgi:hypothetical protein